MPRLIRFIVSFVAVAGAYWLYALIAVPMIEPAAAGPQEEGRGEIVEARHGVSTIVLGELQDLVPVEARAQLETPWIIESDDFKLLLQSYENLDGGRVKIEPCVLVYTPGSSKDDAESKAPIVLYAPAGAVMVFDHPINLRSGDMVGHPTSGRLLGEISITSPGDLEGPEDDLMIVTRDIQLTPDRISTPNAVRFRYGASYGRGKNLVIRLLQNEERPGSTSEPPDIQGIESFELVELDRLHLEQPKRGESTGRPEGETRSSELDTERPLEITCEGPFRFDLVRQYAKFEERVDVFQLNPEGEADQLNCEVLTLYFSRSRDKLMSLDGSEESKHGLAMDESDLQLREIEATGNPVFVRAFSRDAEARGERLSYDIQEQRVVLEGSDRVSLRDGPNKIVARSIHYKSKGKGRLGEIFSLGPGEIQGEMPNRPGQEFSAQWGDRLQLEPFEDQHLATISGGVRLRYVGVGMLEADRIDFWLSELPAGPNREKLEVIPDRMRVQDQVKIDSREMFGNVNLLKIWFDVVDENSPVQAVADVPAEAGPTATSKPTGKPTGKSLADTPGRRDSDKPVERRFYVRGDVAQASVLIQNRKPSLTKLMLEGSVQLDEIPLVQSNEKPMHLEGDRVVVSDAHDKTQTEISVIGRLARFRGRGMALSGTNVNVDAKTNRLWIDGSGEMVLPVDRGIEGEPLPTPDVLTLTWQKEMNFDGRRAQFEERVLAQTQGRRLQTETLEVEFNRRVVFHDLQSKSHPEIDVEKLACRDGVSLIGRTYEDFMQRSAVGDATHFTGTSGSTRLPPHLEPSWEQFHARELTINRRTGDIAARGPGQVTTIRRAPENPIDDPLGQARRSSVSHASEARLSYLHVQFRKMMTGNIERREATFHEVTHCIYDEVDSWQPEIDINDPDSLGKRGMALKAARLTVAQAPGLEPSTRSIELEANENVIVENSTYTAWGNRITYSEIKDWLILEGNGYAPAELTFEEYVGASARSFSARKIHFRPKTKEVKIDDGRALQMSALPLP